MVIDPIKPYTEEDLLRDMAEIGCTVVFVVPTPPKKSWWRRLIGGSR